MEPPERPPPKPGDPILLSAILEDIDIRGVTFSFPSGPVQGYQWRYRVTLPPPHIEGQTDKMTEWVFGSRESVEAMLEKWQQYLREGTLGPGTQLQ